MADEVLLLGDPRLRAACERIDDASDPLARAGFARLKAALDAFRAERGFGRGIAAPQIGIARRFIAVNLSGRERVMERLGRPESELLQHEIDHLDGVLAIDRAVDRESVVYRAAFAADPDYFRSLVDYVIPA